MFFNINYINLKSNAKNKDKVFEEIAKMAIDSKCATNILEIKQN